MKDQTDQDIRERVEDLFEEASDEDLVDITKERLKFSFSHRGDPFHHSHDIVHRLQSEFESRDKMNLFSLAFRKFDNEVSGNTLKEESQS